MKRLLRQRAAMRWLSAIVLVLASLAVFRPSIALAAPTNDNFANATVIGSLPFSDTVDNTTATTEPGEPLVCNPSQTVWYAVTPTANGVLRADMGGSSFYDTELNVWQAVGPGFGGLSFLGCQQFNGSVTFNAVAGTTYYIQAGDIFGSGGTLHLNVQQIPPPPNDDFANAMPITALPFSNAVDASAATLQPREPTPSCGYGSPAGTVWYAFTSATSGSVSASVNSYYQTVVAAYTGSSLTGLTNVGCRPFGQVLTIPVNAGQTYYFQVGFLSAGQFGSLTFSLIVTPPPTASFYFYPSDPSIFDTVQFIDNSFDPGGLGIQSWAWSLGDGATATVGNPTHRYATDGDYTVKDTVLTPDGRTASFSQVVHVQTHEVAITKFTVPNTARMGQTKLISVGVSNNRYPETVQVQLWKSAPGGFVPVGTLTQSVPVQKSNGTVPFAFSYTFTSDDAVAGKVTFQAVATILGPRDALPADNTAISLPTTVSR